MGNVPIKEDGGLGTPTVITGLREGHGREHPGAQGTPKVSNSKTSDSPTY